MQQDYRQPLAFTFNRFFQRIDAINLTRLIVDIENIFLFDIRGLESKRPNFGIRRIRSCSQIVLANRFRSIQNFDSFDSISMMF